MSHHTMDLAGLLPLQAPVKAQKKRRLRKIRTGSASFAQGIDGVSEIDGDLFILENDEDQGSADGDTADGDSPALAAGMFGHAAMKTLLQAQEETKLLL